MNRRDFLLSSLTHISAMNALTDLKNFSDTLPVQDRKMPALFIGHGSPMNGIEDNAFSQRWALMGKEIPTPQAVLVVSAHWLTRGTAITAMANPQTIHDFGGFPQALFDVQYPAPGHPKLAEETAGLIKKTKVHLDHDWGLDHGSWSVVKNMYPEANIPVLQLSIDFNKSAQYHYDLATELAALRKKGVLIIGSGNMVHNLRILDWNKPEGGYDWADEMNHTFKRLISEDNHRALINFQDLGKAAALSIPTPDHYLPLLYTLGVKDKHDALSFFNDKTMMGSISMTSVKLN
jgi:4,5-DOPA dioxygenase extradiol